MGPIEASQAYRADIGWVTGITPREPFECCRWGLESFCNGPEYPNTRHVGIVTAALGNVGLAKCRYHFEIHLGYMILQLY